MRCFIAIDLPTTIKKEIEDVKSKFLPVKDSLKFVEYQNLHLTLKFLGEIKKEDIEAINKSIEQVVLKKGEFRVKLIGVGVFPNDDFQRVLWVGLEDNGKIVGIQKELDQALKQYSPSENKEFKSHITFARVKDPKEKQKISEILKKINNFMGSEFVVNEIKLKNSTLTPIGPIYSDIKVFRLGNKNE